MLTVIAEAKYTVHYLIVGLDNLLVAILFALLYWDDSPGRSSRHSSRRNSQTITVTV